MPLKGMSFTLNFVIDGTYWPTIKNRFAFYAGPGKLQRIASAAFP